MNMFVKLFRNRVIGLGGDVIYFFFYFSSAGQFDQWSETILAILVEGHPMNISAKLF